MHSFFHDLLSFPYAHWRLSVTRTRGSVTDITRNDRAKAEQLSEQRMIFTRLAFQLFVLSFVFLPDSISYLVLESGATLPAGMYKVRQRAESNGSMRADQSMIATKSIASMLHHDSIFRYKTKQYSG